jgi:hypothetical protein
MRIDTEGRPMSGIANEGRHELLGAAFSYVDDGK